LAARPRVDVRSAGQLLPENRSTGDPVPG